MKPSDSARTLVTEPTPAPIEADQRLDELWKRGQRPDLRSFVSQFDGAALELDDLLAVIRVDQRRRWEIGERVSVDAYRRAFPSLDDEPEAFFELVYHELLIREELGERVDADEYVRTFPTLADRLRLQLEVHSALSRACGGAAPRPAQSSAPLPEISGYEVLAEIGRGGMGVVYRARQIHPSRHVAIKMILDGRFASRRDLRRFRNEAEAVAALDHPNIVSVHEVGEHQGLQYFSMRLLEGGSLADAGTNLFNDPRRVAELLAEIAGAIHHAHQRGVLHRDLKPANILLDENGRPHVTDFGLAKRVLAQDDLTAPGALVGSPGFMAPEQASGDPSTVTTATDVYGLGAILYSVLTGRAPFEAASARESLSKLQDEPPEPPTKRNPRIPKPLEIICLKCLEKDPARRYPSAQALADDLGRWLAGEPIVARPSPTAVRVWLWIRREPVKAVLAISLAATVTLGAASTLVLWRKAVEHLSDALHEKKLVELANGDLRRAFREVDASRSRERAALDLERAARKRAQDRFAIALEIAGETLTDSGETSILRLPNTDGLRSKVIHRTIDQFRRLQAAIEADPSPEVRDQLASSYQNLSEMLQRVDSGDESIAAGKRSVEIRRKLANEESASIPRAIALSDAARKLGGVQLHFVKLDDALASFEESCKVLEPLAARHPGDGGLLSTLAVGRVRVANLLIRRGRTEQGFEEYQRALNTYAQIARRFPDRDEPRFNLASAVRSYAMAYRMVGRFDEAARLFERARDDLEALYRKNPHGDYYQIRLYDCMNDLAGTYVLQGRFAQAVAATERARDAAEALAHDHAETPSYQRVRAMVYWDLSQRQEKAGAPSRPTLERAVRLFDELVKRYPGVAQYRIDLSRCLYRLATIARDSRDSAAAVDVIRRFIDQQDILLREKNDDAYIGELALGRALLALALIDSDRSLEAAPVLEAAAAAYHKLKSPSPATGYDVACALAQLSVATPPGSDRAALADRAMDELRHAWVIGFRDLGLITADQDLKPLSARADFQLFLRDAAFPRQLFAR
jgi:eukaryotic-like serine/threonine-protein kinase